MQKRFFVILSLLPILTCAQRFTTDGLLDATALGLDTRKPELLSPSDKDRILTDKPTLVWSSRQPIKEYTLQVATDEGFTQLVIELNTKKNEYTVLASDLKTAGTGLTDTNYYWRVKTSSSTYSDARTFIVEDTDNIYVDVNATNSKESGTRGHPYKTINKAIIYASYSADLFSPPKFREVRIAGGTYNTEIIAMLSNITLNGGFNPANWVQNTSTYPTILQAASGNTLVANIAGANNATIKNLRAINNNALGGAAAISVNGSNNLLISDCDRIQGGSGLNSYAISIQSSGTVTVRNSYLVGALVSSPIPSWVTAILVSNSTQLNVENSTVRVSESEMPDGSNQAIYATFSGLKVSSSTVYGGDIVCCRDSAAIQLNYTTNVEITGNTLYASTLTNSGTLQSRANAIHFKDFTPAASNKVKIFNNVILITHSSTGIGIWVENTGVQATCTTNKLVFVGNNTFIFKNTLGSNYGIASPTTCFDIRNNVIYSEVGAGTREGIYESGFNPILKNNLIGGTLSAHYKDGANGYTDCNANSLLDELAGGVGGCPAGAVTTSTLSANAATTQTAAQMFVDAANTNYRLNSGTPSAAYNKGENLTGNTDFNYTTDLTGAARPAAGNWTAGAYE